MSMLILLADHAAPDLPSRPQSSAGLYILLGVAALVALAGLVLGCEHVRENARGSGSKAAWLVCVVGGLALIAAGVTVAALNIEAFDTREEARYEAHARILAAGNPDTAPAGLAKFAADPQLEVRVAAAGNPNTPAAALAALAHDRELSRASLALQGRVSGGGAIIIDGGRAGRVRTWRRTIGHWSTGGCCEASTTSDVAVRTSFGGEAIMLNPDSQGDARPGHNRRGLVASSHCYIDGRTATSEKPARSRAGEVIATKTSSRPSRRTRGRRLRRSQRSRFTAPLPRGPRWRPADPSPPRRSRRLPLTVTRT